MCCVYMEPVHAGFCQTHPLAAGPGPAPPRWPGEPAQREPQDAHCQMMPNKLLSETQFPPINPEEIIPVFQNCCENDKNKLDGVHLEMTVNASDRI